MANYFPPNWEPSTINAEFTHKASEACYVGDLMWYDSNNSCVRPASAFTDGGDGPTQISFAALFAGVSKSQQLATDSTARTCRLSIDGIYEFACTSSTFAVGDYVEPNYSAGALVNQTVKKTTSALRAIGRVVKLYASATTKVKVRIRSKLLTAAIFSGEGAVTATSITCTDASLGIDGKAGASGAGGAIAVTGGAGDGAVAGGAVTVTGGASGAGATGNGGAVTATGGAALSTAGDGGAASLVGGLGTTTGAGGAVILTGGVGGASGAGGAITITSGASAGAGGTAGAVTIDTGAATGGTGAAMTLGGTNATSVTAGRSGVSTIVPNGGTLLVGNATGVATAATGTFQVLGTAAADSTVTIGQWSAAATGPQVALVKSRNAAIGSSTIVQDNDVLGAVIAYADDGSDFATPAASITFAVDGTPGANDMPSEIVFATTADGANSVTDRLVIGPAGTTTVKNTLALGTAGTALGVLKFNGNTSGTITINSLAEAGTYTLTLPPDNGDPGEQLQTDGNGVLTFEAAGSLRQFKNLIGSLRDKAQEALTRIVNADVQAFTYKEKTPGVKVISTGDTSTVYHGVIGDEYPEVMHHNGKIFSPVSAFGELVLAVQALYQENQSLKARLESLGV